MSEHKYGMWVQCKDGSKNGYFSEYGNKQRIEKRVRQLDRDCNAHFHEVRKMPTKVST
jgi:hypothetical protein